MQVTVAGQYGPGLDVGVENAQLSNGPDLIPAHGWCPPFSRSGKHRRRAT